MSFRLKTILGVAAIEAVLVAFLVLGTLNVLRRSAEAIMFERAIHTGQSLVALVTPALEAHDPARLQLQLSQALGVGYLRYVQVLDPAGNVVAGIGAVAPGPMRYDTKLSDLIDGVLDRYQPVVTAAGRIGDVRFGLAAERLATALTRARGWALGAAVLALLAVVVLSAMLGLYLTRYLGGLRDASVRLALGDMSYRIPVSGSDELADTARAFNAMAGRLQQLYADLAARETRFREYSEAVSDWFWETDEHERYTYVSDSFQNVTGRSPDTLLGRRRWDLNSAKMEVDPGQWQEHLGALKSRRPFRDFQYWLEDDQGQPLWVKESGVPRFDETGTFLGYRGAGSDITDAVESANRLHLLSRAIEQSPVAVMITDTSRRIQYVNPKFLEITGYGADEVMGQAASLLKSGDTAPVVYADMTATLERGEEWRGEMLNRRRDGTPYWEEASIQPIRNLEGRVANYLGLMVDVTARKRDQAQLSHLLEELKRSNQDLEQFAAAASHDLKQPLRQISAYSALIARALGPNADDDMRQYLDFLTDGARRMQVLVADLLDYSRVGHGPVGDGIVDMDEVVARALDLLAGAVAESGARISCEPLPRQRGDAGQMERLMQNLISNAIKYRAADRVPEIRITCDDSGVFSVADNGIGIAPDQAERVFLMFQRLHASAVEGTGIGLAICRRIVDRHGGRLWLTSGGEDLGTTFHFTLSARAPDSGDGAEKTEFFSHLP